MPNSWTDTAEEELRSESSVYRNLRKEHLLTAIFMKYFLGEGELTSSDFKACFTDGKDDGGIDAIAKYELDEVDRIALVQSKRVEKIDRNEVFDAAHKVARTIDDLEAGRSSKYSLKLRKAYVNTRGSAENAPMDILICTSANPSRPTRESIREQLRNDSYLQNYNTNVFYADDIEEAIETIEQPREFVE